LGKSKLILLLETENTDINDTGRELWGKAAGLEIVDIIRSKSLGQIVEGLILESDSWNNLVLEIRNLTYEIRSNGLNVVRL